MNRALEEVVVEGAGIDTNVDLHKAILAHPDFSQSAISTQWLSDYFGSPEWERRVRGEDLRTTICAGNQWLKGKQTCEERSTFDFGQS
jgi:acetyl/propionyl-CoA carboxylase alpha subunit